MAAEEAPTEHVLDAACRVALLIGEEATRQGGRHSAYGLAPTDGLFGSMALRRGEELLVAAGLAHREGDIVHPDPTLGLFGGLDSAVARELLLARWLERQQPLWLTVSTLTEEVEWALVPAKASELLTNTIHDAGRREAMLLAAARKFDDARSFEIGNSGEEAVVAACRSFWVNLERPDLAGKVRQVSLISDQLGYDVICPSYQNEPWRLEVKTSSGSSRLRVFLSRNEATVARQIVGWVMIVCKYTEGGTTEIVGWADSPFLEKFLPMDRRPDAKWQSVQIVIDSKDLNPGLPPMGGPNRSVAAAEDGRPQ